MRVLIVDNQDSFTYNIVDLIWQTRQLASEVKSAIGLDVQRVADYDRIIFSPGPGLPQEFPVMAEILQKYGQEKSILGICLGHQAICQFLGAKLMNLNKVIHGQPKTLIACPDSFLLKGFPEESTVGLYHSWVVAEQHFPPNLRITGRSEEGYIMAVEHRHHPLYGVQFHPESFLSTQGKRLIDNFLS